MQINNWQTPLSHRQLELFIELADKEICVPITRKDLGVLLVQFGGNKGWPLLAKLELLEGEIINIKKEGFPKEDLVYIRQEKRLIDLLCRSRLRDTWDCWHEDL